MRKTVMICITMSLMAAPAMQGCASERETTPKFVSRISGRDEPMQRGRFKPTWESLSQYQTPEWFRDAKFGIWAHWGPQCQPQEGDWYARHMYIEGHGQYRSHVATYGHPSVFGFKDVINQWKAERWNPDQLVAFYKRVGAEYFVAMANHHDNFDFFDSAYQPWNSVRIGPKKDIIAGWAAAARAQGLRFGVSSHAAHAWTWYEPAQGADTQGPLAGVPYDGKLTKADGKGQWWEGLDPQDLYAQNHAPSANRNIHEIWHWDVEKGCSVPDAAYCEKFYNRTLDLINKYQPDLVYFDDTVLPLYPISDAGLRIAAHFYNSSMKRNRGNLEAVLTSKILSPSQRRCMVWDIERGQSNRIEPLPWQTDTCIGDWHYNKSVFEGKRYKSAKTVVQMLIDIVSKNGNLLLSIPLRGDGTFDSEAEKVLEGIGDWMAVNRRSIVGTRPWKVFGEGPAIAEAAPLSAQGFNEGRGKPFTWEDIRYTASKDGRTLYMFVMGRPEAAELTPQALRVAAAASDAKVSLLGHPGEVSWRVDKQGQLTLIWPNPAEKRRIDEYACVFQLSGFTLEPNPLYAPDAILLKAENAALEGGQIRLEKKDGRANIGYWDNPAEGVHWLLTVPEEGEYRFRGEFASLGDSGLTLQIDGRKTTFPIPGTGDWSVSRWVEMGTVHFDKPGIYHLRLYPAAVPVYRPVNLWQIQCAKVL